MTTLAERFTLTASGHRSYTFTPLPGGAEVEVAYAGPRQDNTVVVLPTLEARELWLRLLQRGYERW